MFRQNLLKASFFSSILLLSACASTATGQKQSNLVTNAPAQTLKTTAPNGSLLAVVRYPAVVAESAKEEYRKSYISSPIGGNVSKNSANSTEAENIIDSTIVKSNYYALSLYKELAARLPEHSVLLSPHEIKLDENGKLTSEPITKAENLPSVVTVDFAAYSFPDPKKMMDKNPLTFGDLISPMVSVRTDHRAAVPTYGVKLASRPLVKAAVSNSMKTAAQGLTEVQSGRFDQSAPALDFVAFLSGDRAAGTPERSLSLSNEDHAVQIAPLEKIKMNGGKIMALSNSQQGSVDPLQPVFSTGFADRIIDIINDTASEKSAMARRAAAISTYDPSLAALTFAGSNKPDYNARYNYVSRLLDAERKYLSVQSLRLFDGVHNGEMGAQVRDMLKAEYKVLERRRELARKQNQATALAVLGAVAAGASMSNQGSSSTQCDRYGNCRVIQRPNYGQRILTDVLINASIYAGTQAFAYKRESKAVGNNYLTSIVPALEQQTNIQVDLIDSSETITAIRFEDLQDKLKNLYSEKQRSLETIATRCAYRHGNEEVGTWMGVCEGGYANGSGVGVFKHDDGSAIEYYGHAVNGRPHGSGYLVVYDKGGAYSLEGRFIDGEADGVMRVARAGKPDELRKYANGKDTGSAPSGSHVSSPFERDKTGA